MKKIAVQKIITTILNFISEHKHIFMPTLHDKIINEMKNLQYHPSEEGVCAGFSLMAAQAFLSDDLKAFFSRLEMISNTPGLAKQLRKVERKRQDQIQLDEEELAISEIRPFFDGIALGHMPEIYSETLNRKVFQSQTEYFAHLLSSQKLDEQGGLVKVFERPGIYCHDELASLLRIIAQTAKERQSKFATILSTADHAISLCFDHEKDVWILMNIDNVKSMKASTFTTETLPKPYTVHLQKRAMFFL